MQQHADNVPNVSKLGRLLKISSRLDKRANWRVASLAYGWIARWGGRTSVTAVLEKVTNEQPLLKAPYDREETAAKATLAIPGMETVVAGGGGTGRALSEGLLAIYSLPCRTGKS